MTTHRDRIKSIHTPPRRDKVSPSKREPREDAGPTAFALQRKAETIGAGTYCDVSDRKVGMAKNVGTGTNHKAVFSKATIAQAEFASSGALERLRHEDRLTSEQFRAGSTYRRLHRLLFGSTVPRESSLTKAMATPLEERLRQEAVAARDERDDEEHAEWLTDQRTMYERGEHAMARIMVPLDQTWARQNGMKHRFAKVASVRMQVRATVRAVCVDDRYPRVTLIPGLRMGLETLVETWEIK